MNATQMIERAGGMLGLGAMALLLITAGMMAAGAL
jgi:hypothetical protein